MKHFRTLILGFVVTMAFAACGEGFKAKKLAVDAGGGDINPPASQTPVEVDKEIAVQNGYDPLSLNDNSAGSQATTQRSQLLQEIGAFEIVTEVVSHPGGASDNLRIEAIYMGSSCNSREVSIENRTATLEQFESGNRLEVGASNQYRVDVRCSNDDCSNLVATLRRSQSDSFFNQPLLFGLAATRIERAGNTVRTTYTSRLSEVSVYRTVMSIAQKINSCIQGPFLPPTAGDPTQGDFIPQGNSQTNENESFFPQNQAL